MKFVHQIILNLFVFFLFFINTVHAHTNSVGFSVSTNNLNSSTYDVEAFFGSWHTGTISPDGRAILYSLDPGGDSTLASDYNNIAYGDNNEITGDNEFEFTRATTTSSITLSDENSNHTYTQSDITTAGFTPGTDYFWVDNLGNLMDTNVGSNGNVYNHQSAVVVGVAPGTYRLDYELPTPTGFTWRPEPGVDNVVFTINSDGSIVINPLASPLDKKDVIGSTDSWIDIVSRWAETSVDAAYNRMDWLRRHQDTTRTSHQGIKLHFKDKVINAVMNTSVNPQMFSDIDYASKAASLLQNTDGSLVAVGEHIKSDAINIAINEAARIRKDAIGSLNPTFGPVVDNWSVWTDGKVLVGKKEETTSASEQNIVAESIAIGFDRPTSDDGVVGFVLNFGQDNTDVGTALTNVNSDNYSLSTYRAFRQDDDSFLESVIGLGHLEFDTVRIDGSDTLTGTRKANQIFLSTVLKREDKIKVRGLITEHNNFLFSPYTKLSLAHTRLDGFSETGGETALTFDGQNVNDATLHIGADINSLIPINRGSIKPFGKLEYNASVSDTSATMHYSSESTNYTAELDKTNVNWKLGYGIDFMTKGGWNSSASYMREESISSSETSQYSDSFRFNVGVGF